MRYSVASALSLAITIPLVSAQDACKATEDGGNYYCSPVDSIVYSGFQDTSCAAPGSFSGNSCTWNATYSAKGPLAPFNDELAMIFRGPMNLKGFAVYTTGDSTSSKKRHVHQRHHARNAHHHLQRSNGRVDYEKRNPAGNIVSVAGLGTWTNDYTGGGASTAAPQATSSSTAASDQGTTQDTGVSNKEVSSDNSTSSSGTWTRVAYYDSKSQKADGLTFFNAKQYDGSTNGLSYASSDGTAKASKPTVFNDKMLSDDTEIMMFSDKFCKDDCLPYSGLGPKGFAGDHKIFIAEFNMPLTGNRAFNGDMPAYWILNANIPRTQQYGNCSIKSCGGEFDVLEVLTSGETRGKSTVHGKAQGGDSHVITRPTDSNETVQVVTFFDGEKDKVYIKVLQDSKKIDLGSNEQLATNVITDLRAPATKAAQFKLSED